MSATSPNYFYLPHLGGFCKQIKFNSNLTAESLSLAVVAVYHIMLIVPQTFEMKSAYLCFFYVQQNLLTSLNYDIFKHTNKQKNKKTEHKNNRVITENSVRPMKTASLSGIFYSGYFVFPTSAFFSFQQHFKEILNYCKHCNLIIWYCDIYSRSDTSRFWGHWQYCSSRNSIMVFFAL